MRFATGAILFVAAAALVAAAAPAWAGVDIDFGADLPLGDDGHLFVRVSSRYFDVPVPTVERVVRRLPNPDDVAVALFLSARSGRSPDAILSLRTGGRAWFDIGIQVGVPRDVWFVPVQVVPTGPPYGKAYGHWKKHRHDPRAEYRLNDRQVRDLVAARVVHEYYGVPAEDALRRRAHGGDVRLLVAEEYRGRHGKDKGAKGGDKGNAGHGPDHGKQGDGGSGQGGGKGHGKK